MDTGFVQRGLSRSSPKNAAAPLYKNIHTSTWATLAASSIDPTGPPFDLLNGQSSIPSWQQSDVRLAERELPVLLIPPPKNNSSARQLKPRGTRQNPAGVAPQNPVFGAKKWVLRYKKKRKTFALTRETQFTAHNKTKIPSTHHRTTMRPLARGPRVLVGWPLPLGFGLGGCLLLARRGRVYV